VTTLVAKYHDQAAEGGRDHRIVIAIHPSFTTPTDLVPVRES
jgi:hypothetical protein